MVSSVSVSGCAPPNTRRAVRSVSVIVATASRRSSSDASYLNVNGGQWRDEDVLASGLSRVAVEPAPKRRRRREPAVRFTAPLLERHDVQGQYDQQNRRP